MTDTRTTDTTTPTSSSSDLGSPTVVGSLRALTEPLSLLRLLQLLSTCIAFSLVANVNAWVGFMGNWCMFTWCFCFAVTLLILLVDLAGLQTRFPLTWRNFSITYACYAALFCLSSSVIYPTTYAQFLPLGRTRDHAIAATAFSCIAFVAYATEVAWTRARPGESTDLMATVPRLLKVLETFVACVIFAFISEPSLFHQPALEWCMFVFAICFIHSAMNMLHNLSVCTIPLRIHIPTFLSTCFALLSAVSTLLSALSSVFSALLPVLLYATALVIWPLYHFDEKFGGIPQRSDDPYCSRSHIMVLCNWDRCLVVTILTAINFLAYLGDLVCSSRLVFVRFQNYPKTSLYLLSPTTGAYAPCPSAL